VIHQRVSDYSHAKVKWPRSQPCGVPASLSRPLSPRTSSFLESRRKCSLLWELEGKMWELGRLNITPDDALVAIRAGRLSPHDSDRSRYIARWGRLVVTFSAERPCHNFCITAYYRRW